jgi:hypothetical protein
VSTPSEVRDLAVNGWDKEAQAAVDVADGAIETIEQEHEIPSFQPLWDVTGSVVDIDRYLSGEPENMIDFTPAPITKFGRVIVLCASVSFSGSIRPATIKRRGQTVAALAFALNSMGFATELWADLSASGSRHTVHARTLVKGANDELDPARIMFAYSHPAMLRGLALPAMHAYPDAFKQALGVGSSYGSPKDPKRDLPEGTIYLPSVCSDSDVPEAAEALLGYLRDLGIVTD